jgi:hypothetical protein
MIGQRAAALLVGDAKQSSALLRVLALVDRGGVVGGDVRVAACCTRGRRRAVRLECEREVVLQWCRRFEIGALDAVVGSRAQQLQALLARVQNTAVHIEDLSLGKLEHAATPGTALGVDGAVRARVRFASQQRCVESDACRAELASRCCQQLLAVRAMLASVGDGRADESSDLLLAVCLTLLAMPLPEDFRLQTCARLLIAVHSPTD